MGNHMAHRSDQGHHASQRRTVLEANVWMAHSDEYVVLEQSVTEGMGIPKSEWCTHTAGG